MMPITSMFNTDAHPCYNCGASRNARIHLPVAPKCNIQCNYCLRKYDCVNESRPGVVSEVLTPEQSAKKFKAVKEKLSNITIVGIAGPGDALANWEQTAQTLQLVSAIDKDVMFCLSTNGLMLPDYVSDLFKLGVSHLTVTLNAVEPKIGEKIYKWIEHKGKRYTGF
jgi:nitrogenase cofactor biosynthesis protein NifB